MTGLIDHRSRLDGISVLIADDEVLIALDLEAAFQAAGARVIGPWLTLAEALDSASRDDFDIAVLDIRLSDHSCEPLAHTLVRNNIPFMFYSGQGIPQSLADHGIRLIEKPASLAQVVHAAADLVASRRIDPRRING